MNISKVVVPYGRLNTVLSSTQESTMAATVAARGGFESTDDSANQAAAFQAGLNVALAKLQMAEHHGDVLSATDHDMASLLQSFIAERAVEEDKVMSLPRSGGFEATFDEKDWVGWAKSFFTWWKGIVPHRWLNASSAAETVPDQLRVAVLGDWGTGLYGAPTCAQSIAKDAAKFQLLLHLGDVYYSGTDTEVAERFLALWPQVDGALNRALNSNHEMYTGGHAYFQQTLREFNQKASYFALQNNDWLLVGLDTAYDDHDLREPQATWLRGLLAHNDRRRLVLFSHHQPFSLIDNQGPKLVEKLAEFLNTGRIFAWYWGHEHRCVMYDRHPTWGFFGRCVGHSGYPYFREPVRNFQPDPEHRGWLRIPATNMAPSGIVLDGSNRYVVGHEDEYGPNGYMTLEFNGASLTERVHSAEGDVVYKKTLA